jgi:hypothetical protein
MHISRTSHASREAFRSCENAGLYPTQGYHVYDNQPTCAVVCASSHSEEQKKRHVNHNACSNVKPSCPYYTDRPVSNAEWYPRVAKIRSKTPVGNAEEYNSRLLLCRLLSIDRIIKNAVAWYHVMQTVTISTTTLHRHIAVAYGIVYS